MRLMENLTFILVILLLVSTFGTMHGDAASYQYGCPGSNYECNTQCRKMKQGAFGGYCGGEGQKICMCRIIVTE